MVPSKCIGITHDACDALVVFGEQIFAAIQACAN